MPSCMQELPRWNRIQSSGDLLIILGEWHDAVEGTQQFVMQVQHLGDGLLSGWTCEA